MANFDREKTYYCEKCNRTMRGVEFYTSNNLEKYPNDGKINMCKKCMTMHVDNWNPETYLWILKEIDVPYVPKEWSRLMDTYGKDRSKLTGMSILGRYLSKMKLKQYKDFRWKDTEYLQEKENNAIETAMKGQGYDAQDIAEAIERNNKEFAPASGRVDAPDFTDELRFMPEEHTTSINVPYPQEDYFAQQSGGEDDYADLDLTDEDRTYLRLKWGKAYRPEEWVKLEQLYEEMMSSYDIQTAGHKDTLKLICKTSLKANQLIDMGDVEGFQKMSKVYDSLMKSGKFTAAQNKENDSDFVDSIGELIEMCEKEGYIERYYIDSPNDKVDFTIQDMQRYTRSLIEDETNLGSMVEKALRENAKEDEESAKNKESDIVDDADLSIEDLEKTIQDKEYSDFEDFQEEQELADQQYINGESDGT